ncbi:hypothetical protein HanIR_Chr16g0840601 [Helianthus annuus]|nr:hypothetical protein HanIR_Chr16g0840601 [Helianthus annuus]
MAFVLWSSVIGDCLRCTSEYMQAQIDYVVFRVKYCCSNCFLTIINVNINNVTAFNKNNKC